MPRLVPDMSSPSAHVEFSRNIALTQVLRDAAAQVDVLSKIRFACDEKDKIRTLRDTIISTIENLNSSVSCKNDEFRKLMPADSPARYLNFALIISLAQISSHKDTDLVRDLLLGMPLTGAIPSSNTLPAADKPALTTIPELLQKVEERNNRIIANLKKRSKEETRLCWEMTRSEVERDMVSPLQPADSDTLKSQILNPRFVIEQNGKHRIIDDLKASRVNDTTACSDTYKPDTLDSLVVHIQKIREFAPSGKVKIFAFDFKSAYKHISVAEESHEAASIVILHPETNEPWFGRLKSQPFGSRVSPRNWGRVVAFFKHVAKFLFGVILHCYVDDGFSAE